MSISFADLEFEHGRLVKVRGMRPEYASGGQLIDMVRDLACLCAAVTSGGGEQTDAEKEIAELEQLAGLVGAKFTPHERKDAPPTAAEDIVDRLRNRMVFGLYWDFAREAADEIVRLRSENDAIRNGGSSLPPSAFKLRDFICKKSGAWWEGRVVGFYSTEQTPDGVCVQLDKPNGPVQIYPAEALVLSPAPVDELTIERDAIGAEARRYAGHYPEASDGRNTFVIFAEWVEARGAKEKR